MQIGSSPDGPRCGRDLPKACETRLRRVQASQALAAVPFAWAFDAAEDVELIFLVGDAESRLEQDVRAQFAQQLGAEASMGPLLMLSARSPPRRSTSRWVISPAALLVNVKAQMRAGRSRAPR
jgi:hypothetical protein